MKQKIEIEVPEGKELKLVESSDTTIKYEIVDEEIKLPTSIMEMNLLTIKTNLYPTGYTPSLIALSVLIAIKDKWIELTYPNWKANWNDALNTKYCITRFKSDNNIHVQNAYLVEVPLVFPTIELAKKFLNTPEFKDLFKVAKPLL